MARTRGLLLTLLQTCLISSLPHLYHHALEEVDILPRSLPSNPQQQQTSTTIQSSTDLVILPTGSSLTPYATIGVASQAASSTASPNFAVAAGNGTFGAPSSVATVWTSQSAVATSASTSILQEQSTSASTVAASTVDTSCTTLTLPVTASSSQAVETIAPTPTSTTSVWSSIPSSASSIISSSTAYRTVQVNAQSLPPAPAESSSVAQTSSSIGDAPAYTVTPVGPPAYSTPAQSVTSTRMRSAASFESESSASSSTIIGNWTLPVPASALPSSTSASVVFSTSLRSSTWTQVSQAPSSSSCTSHASHPTSVETSRTPSITSSSSMSSSSTVSSRSSSSSAETSSGAITQATAASVPPFFDPTAAVESAASANAAAASHTPNQSADAGSHANAQTTSAPVPPFFDPEPAVQSAASANAAAGFPTTSAASYWTSIRTTTIVVDETVTITSCDTSIFPMAQATSPPEEPFTSGESASPSSSLIFETQSRLPNNPAAAPQSTQTPTNGPSATVPMATIVQTSSGSVSISKTTLTVSLRTTLTTSATQTVTVTASPMTSGSVQTSLQSIGNPSKQPFNATVIPTPSSAISPILSGTSRISTSTTITPSSMPSGNIFAPVASGSIPSQFSSRGDHPVPRQGISQGGPVETNKFYANFFLGGRNASAFTFPYSLAWSAGQGGTGSWGIAISHVTRDQTVYGPGNPASYYVNPLGLQSIIVSARQLGGSTSLTMTALTGFAATANLAPAAGQRPMISFPMVQGMGFITAVYNAGTPLLQSVITFRSMVFGGRMGTSGTVRYTITLNDDTVWFVYLTPAAGSALPTLTLATPQQIIGDVFFTGTLQVAKAAQNTLLSVSQQVYDASAGAYPTNGLVTGSASGNSGSYTLSWSKAGVVSKRLLMFALPHHLASFGSQTRSAVQQNFVLQTTTKGLGTAVVADSWLLQESLPTSLEFAPWSPSLGSVNRLPASAAELIRQVAAMELNEDIEGQTDLNSMYYAGKALAKFATIVYTTNNLAGATATASAGLIKLKNQFDRFVSNTQMFPLVYDSSWGGLVSSASYPGGPQGNDLSYLSNLDFGNTNYNDHHFHYGYFVYAAAVIAHLDPSWLQQGTNKAWVQSLVRDYANPVSNDGYFPFSRMFDWYHGHSWAAGLYESFDGKNQESSSEDSFASYAIKLWGRAIGDANMEARGNLMLAIQARSFSDYYLMQSSNTIQPSRFTPNKAAGILFENKIDHTTYFGNNIEYIEGIHMLPLNPSSTLTRPSQFVEEEWDTYFSNGRVDSINSGWKGILYANYATINPRAAYAFFSQSGFQPQWLDGGASRTWYLAWSAALGGAS